MSAPGHSSVSIWSAHRFVLIQRRDRDRPHLALGILVLGCAGRYMVPRSVSQRYPCRRGMKNQDPKVVAGHGGHSCSHGPGCGRALGHARFLGRRRHSRMPSSRPTADVMVRQQAYPISIVSSRLRSLAWSLWPNCNLLRPANSRLWSRGSLKASFRHQRGGEALKGATIVS